MKIAVIGTGYVGLVAGACFADSGNEVICVDIDEAKVDRLTRGEIPIFEPGLESIVRRNVSEGRLSFTTELRVAVGSSRVIFLAVGTPPLADGSADMSQVDTAVRHIAEAADGPKIVVNKSTVPLGTAERIRSALTAHSPFPFEVVSNPEFLKEGSAVDDFLRPDRVVIGTDSADARETMAELYAPFVRNGNPIIFMDPPSAELTKYAANAMLALRISFMNELSRFAEAYGADIDIVRRGIGTDVRIGKHFLFAGVGYGGSCFPKDVKALMHSAREHDAPLTILEAVDAVNETQKRVLYTKIARHFGGALAGLKVAVWGLAFKPNTDDMREAPSLTLIDELVSAGAVVAAHDPVAMPAALPLLDSRVQLCRTAFEAAQGADALAIVTEWNEFRSPDLERLKAVMRQPVVFDGRNVLSAQRMRELGFSYYSIGRP